MCPKCGKEQLFTEWRDGKNKCMNGECRMEPYRSKRQWVRVAPTAMTVMCCAAGLSSQLRCVVVRGEEGHVVILLSLRDVQKDVSAGFLDRVENPEKSAAARIKLEAQQKLAKKKEEPVLPGWR